MGHGWQLYISNRLKYLAKIAAAGGLDKKIGLPRFGLLLTLELHKEAVLLASVALDLVDRK